MNKANKNTASCRRTLFTAYQACRLCSPGFVDEACYSFFLLRLRYRVSNHGVSVHAFCLLPDRLYLLATAPAASSIGQLLASVNQSYSAYFGERFRREGKVWSTRPVLMPVTGEHSSLEFQVLIERMGMAMLGQHHPGLHRWSSYSRNAFSSGSGWLERLPALSSLAPTAASSGRYRDAVMRPLAAGREISLLNFLHGARVSPGKHAQHCRQDSGSAVQAGCR